jgi:hypothetical protein
MAPLITLYILGGCVAAAAVLFIVMIVFSALRPPPLPMPAADTPPLKRLIRALTPPFATATANPRVGAKPGTFDTEEATIPLRPANAVALVAAPRGAKQPAPPSLPSALSRTAETSFEPARPVAPQRSSPPPLPGLPPRGAAPPSLPPRAAPPAAPVTRAPTSVPALPSIRPAPPSFAAAPALMPSRWSPDATSPGSFASTPSTARRLPVYPTHRGRTLLRILGALLATVTLASAIVVARPSLLDPLCDELDWFGSGTAADLRERARQLNVELGPCIEALQETPAIAHELSTL